MIIIGAAAFSPPLRSYSQEVLKKDTISISAGPDTAGVNILANDTVKNPATDSTVADTLRVKVSSSAIKSEVRYSARDSIVYDLSRKTVNMFGEAKVSYEKIQLTAANITYGFSSNLVEASGIRDSSGTLTSRPVFTDNGQSYESDTLRYNFKTKKGAIKGVYTALENQAHIYGKLVKKDTNDVLWIKGGEFCPCEDKDSKTRIRVNKIKVIPEEKIITGAGYLTLSDIPTPIAFPFGLFPNNEKRSAGILLPSYGESANLGFFLLNGGYYQPISDHLDLQVTGDIYSKGSFAMRGVSKYNTLYKNQGTVALNYSVMKSSYREFRDFSQNRNFGVQWSHQQDPRARPNTTFNAVVNVISGSTYKNNLNISTAEFLSNSFNSNVNYGKSWSGKPYQLSVNASHSQNTQSREVSVTFPSATFALSRITLPLGFLKGATVTEEKWFEKLNFNYSANLANRITTTEPEVRLDNFNRLARQFRNGIQHQAALGTSLKLANFTLNPSFNYNERWYLSNVEYRKNQLTDADEFVREYGFNRDYNYNLNLSLTTQLFGMFTFRKTRISAIRHMMTPSVSLYYQPAFNSDRLFRGLDSVSYNPLQQEIFGFAKFAESGGLNFNLSNNLEMKVKTPRDTVSDVKKVRLLDAFNLSTQYDIFRDSVRWSPIRFDLRTVLFKNINVAYTGVLDPYDYDFQGRSLNVSLLKSRGRLFRMKNSNLSVGATLGTIEPQNPKLRKKGEKLTLKHILPAGIPLAVNFNYQVYFDRNVVAGRDTLEIKQTLNGGGSIQLLRRLGVNFQSGYDFKSRDLTYTTLRLYADLNCWELAIEYIPTGIRKSVNLRLNMKSQLLKDVKLEQRRNLGENNLLF